jgi:hypothetical protein
MSRVMAIFAVPAYKHTFPSPYDLQGDKSLKKGQILHQG